MVYGHVSFFWTHMHTRMHTHTHTHTYIYTYTGHDINFCGHLPSMASEILLSLALLRLSPALQKLYVL